MNPPQITLHALHIGRPETLSDESGTWRSSIFRERVDGPLELGERGLAGDKVADTRNHGSPDQAVCAHSLAHYDYWNEFYGLTGDAALGPGGVGENWTVEGALEADLCIGDIFKVGSARVQVSAPRFPCSKQNRKLGLSDLQERTAETMRTGFYLRVLSPGVVEAGDVWTLESRPQPELTLHDANACVHHAPRPELAARLLDAPELAEGWKHIIGLKLKKV